MLLNGRIFETAGEKEEGTKKRARVLREKEGSLEKYEVASARGKS